MGKVRLDCNYLKLLLLLSELYFIFIHHELASLCLGCLFAFLIAPNSLIDCGVPFDQWFCAKSSCPTKRF